MEPMCKVIRKVLRESAMRLNTRCTVPLSRGTSLNGCYDYVSAKFDRFFFICNCHFCINSLQTGINSAWLSKIKL